MVRRFIVPIALAAVVGCADNRTTIEIRGHAFPVDTADGCTFRPESQFQLGNGILDVQYALGYGGAGAPTYGAVLYVTNHGNNPTTAETTPGSTVSGSSWRALAARVRVNPSDYTSSFPPSPALIPLRSSIRVPLDGLTTRPGQESTQFVQIVDPALGALIAAATVAGPPRMLVVGVTLEGETLDGTRVDSGEWFYGIEVCRGCQPTACVDPAKTLSSCFGRWQDPIFCI